MKKTEVVIEKRNLTWNDLANIYDRVTGRTARTQPMDTILAWAKKQKDRFLVDDDGVHSLVLLDVNSKDDL